MKTTNRTRTFQRSEDVPHHTLRRILLNCAFALTAAVLMGCAGGNNPDLAPAPPTGKPDSMVSISGIDFSSLQSGWIYSTKALSEIESANHFDLSFNLEPGGSLTLSANGIVVAGSDRIDRGIEFEFRRSADANDPRLTVFGRASGGEDDWSAHFVSLDARQTVTVALDIHNNEGDQSHLVAWGGGSEDPIFESSSRAVGGAPGRGYGMFWGFKLDRATVVAVALEGPREDHEH